MQRTTRRLGLLVGLAGAGTSAIVIGCGGQTIAASNSTDDGGRLRQQQLGLRQQLWEWLQQRLGEQFGRGRGKRLEWKQLGQQFRR